MFRFRDDYVEKLKLQYESRANSSDHRTALTKALIKRTTRNRNNKFCRGFGTDYQSYTVMADTDWLLVWLTKLLNYKN